MTRRIRFGQWAMLALLLTGCQGEFSLDAVDDPQKKTQPDASVDLSGVPDMSIDATSDINEEPPPCETPRAVFQTQTWPKAGHNVCVGCHVSGGVAQNQGSTFLLKDEAAITTEGLTLDGFYEYNLDQFRQHADLVGGQPKFISKALGVDHGGGEVAPPNSAAYQALEALVTSFDAEGVQECTEPPPLDPIGDLVLLTPQQTLRKASLQLGGTLPSDADIAALEGLDDEAAMAALDTQLQDMMQGQGFHEWLKYAWNEVFMFRGLWELDVTFNFMVVHQNDFGTRTWGFIGRNNFLCTTLWEGQVVWERFGYASEAECDNNLFGRDYMGDRVAWSLIEGPLELIAWVVEGDRPFTDILTTETVMMNYYSSVVYFGSALPDNNPYVAQYMNGLPIDTIEHPAGSTLASVSIPYMHQFQPMQSMKRSRRYTPPNTSEVVYEYLSDPEWPRAGLLTDQLYLTRYPTTDTNVNRHRTWAFFNQFLGLDILSLADRRGDPAQAELNSDQPTIDDPNCNVCHNPMDPVAGLFQDFGVDARYTPTAAWPPRNQPAMIGPGISNIGPTPNTEYDPENTLSPLQWLGAETAKDPRFASTMVRHAFMQLTGHAPMDAPSDVDAPGWAGRIKAFEQESEFLNTLRSGFVANNFSMKWLYREIIKSPWYRATGAVAEAADDSNRMAGVESFGDEDQLLTPFEMHRKVEAVMGRPWNLRQYVMRGNNLNVIDENAPKNDYLLRFNSENDFRFVDPIYRDMYGGIDFLNNTSRLVRPSSVMAAVGRRVSSEFACATVAQDFALAAANRRFFRNVQPAQGLADNQRGVRQTMIDLHALVVGRTPSAQEVQAMETLFENVRTQGQQGLADANVSADLPPHCQALERQDGQTGAFTAITQDPDYGIRSWMAVVSYLALDPEFIYRW